MPFAKPKKKSKKTYLVGSVFHYCFTDENLQAPVQGQAIRHRAKTRQGRIQSRAPEPSSYTLCYKLCFDGNPIALFMNSLSEN